MPVKGEKCGICSKTDFDVAAGCLNAGIYSTAVGDWMCFFGTGQESFSKIKDPEPKVNIEGLKEEIRALKKERDYLANRLQSLEKTLLEIKELLK